MTRSFNAAFIAAATVTLSGCLVLPKVDMNQPVPCPLVTREITLDTVQLAHIEHCYGDACLLQLSTGAVVFAASLLVSGSVALVGNTIHWIERVGKCGGRSPAEPSPAVPPVQTAPG
jgi:hypothetical protein